MVFDQYFMVIPVYRLSEDKYYSQMKEDFKKLVSRSWDVNFQRNNPGMVEGWRRSHRSSYGGDWEFNEVVGHIKLFFMGSQIRGEYWSTESRRKVRTRKKRFEFKAHKLVAEGEIWEKTSDGVLAAIEEYLSRCKKELKDRHIDLREFEALKNHVNWLSVHKTTNVFA
ncbi:hypothetical protein GCM10011365_03580 [Marinicella pacifica]|uniref:Uncharacterized protein n=1 Tax=Marinicella pacifica TaxID=1171543 RepID=A0A917CHE8_9GAMM|nr:hypothetical protein [Marinicella pacifica]GGF85824.1 hypothetical protein GCM10011365_03580 [Marinicella pacifica]